VIFRGKGLTTPNKPPKIGLQTDLPSKQIAVLGGVGVPVVAGRYTQLNIILAILSIQFATGSKVCQRLVFCGTRICRFSRFQQNLAKAVPNRQGTLTLGSQLSKEELTIAGS
jgi:hypothetical protein